MGNGTQLREIRDQLGAQTGLAPCRKLAGFRPQRENSFIFQISCRPPTPNINPPNLSTQS